MSPEKAMFEFIQALVEAADPEAPIAPAAVHATVYEEIKTTRAIRVGDARADVGPRAGAWKEFNTEFYLEIIARVDDNNFFDAREAVRDMGLALAEAIQSDPSLGNRVCDVHVKKGSRGWARVQTAAFAVQVFRIVVDPVNFQGG